MSTKSAVRAIALGSALLASSADASFHLMKVVEVFPGTAAAPNAQYVNIQMYSPGQTFVGGHHITVFGPTGSIIQTFTFGGSVLNGSSQVQILIATVEAVGFFGLTADLAMSPVLPLAGGKVCFDAIPEDCLAWGNYSGSPTGTGTPFNALAGLVSGSATIRRLDIAGGASTLEAADDTDNCASDFVFGTPSPRNNVGSSGTIPAAACGNSLIEGLEQCDDGNSVNSGDGCTNLCQIEPNIFLDSFE